MQWLELGLTFNKNTCWGQGHIMAHCSISFANTRLNEVPNESRQTIQQIDISFASICSFLLMLWQMTDEYFCETEVKNTENLGN